LQTRYDDRHLKMVIAFFDFETILQLLLDSLLNLQSELDERWHLLCCYGQQRVDGPMLFVSAHV